MCKFNVVFQSDIPMLPALKAEVHQLLRILLGRFVLAGADITFMDINLQDTLLQLPDDQLGIGQEAWAYLSSQEDSLDPNVQRLFFNGVIEFYMAIASTIIRKFPFTDTDDVAIFLPSNRCLITWNQVCRLAQRFSVAVPQESINALGEEVLDYKLTPTSSLPNYTVSGEASYSVQLNMKLPH